MPDLLVYIKGAETNRKKVRFARKRLVIGRASECDITLGHGTLSRQHLAIEEIEGQWYVEDLGSSNGTRLNGKKIEQREAIGDGDRVAAGRVRLIVSGLGGRRTSIFRNRLTTLGAGADDIGLDDLNYGAADYLDGDDLAAVDDDEDMDMDSLDLDGGDAEIAEIELNTLIRSAVDGGILASGNDDVDPEKLQAWDDLFGEVDDEVDKS